MNEAGLFISSRHHPRLKGSQVEANVKARRLRTVASLTAGLSEAGVSLRFPGEGV